LVVDDDRAVLNAVERDLRRQYGRDYRLVKSDSGEAALRRSDNSRNATT
jgi:thioredoxin reductase (NADPH)